MKVLVVGGGGREHALCWKLRQSPLLSELYCAPGNPGIAAVADLVPIAAEEIARLADFAADAKIDLTVVGPELPLSLGIADEFQHRGLRDLRAAAARGRDRGLEGLRQGVHGAPRHPDRAVRDRRRRGGGAPRRRALRLPGRAQGRRSGRAARASS